MLRPPQDHYVMEDGKLRKWPAYMLPPERRVLLDESDDDVMLTRTETATRAKGGDLIVGGRRVVLWEFPGAD